MKNPGFIVPGKPSPGGPGEASVIIYGYVPAIQLCGLGVLTFFIALIAHTWRTARSRSCFTVPFILACFAEMLGYIFRSLSSKKDPYKTSYFVAQYFLITTAPIMITASMYICLTRILSIMEVNGIPIPYYIQRLGRRAILWIFITADIVTTIVQIAGSALIGVATSKFEDPTKASNIVMAGIAIQSFFFCIYYVLLTSAAVPFWQRRHVLANNVLAAIVPSLWVASAMILVRLVFRLVESGDGVFGFVWTHEALFGVLEFAPILLAMIIMAIWHPGRQLSNSDHRARASPKCAETSVASLA